MPVDVVTETLITLPRGAVAAFASNPDNAPVWYDNIKSVEWVTPPPASQGSQVAFVAHFLGRRLAYTYEIARFIPGVEMVMRTSQGPFPMETTYGWTDRDNGTLMTLRNRGEPSGFSRLVSPLMATMMRRANVKDLARLKQHLEAGAPVL